MLMDVSQAFTFKSSNEWQTIEVNNKQSFHSFKCLLKIDMQKPLAQGVKYHLLKGNNSKG